MCRVFLGGVVVGRLDPNKRCLYPLQKLQSYVPSSTTVCFSRFFRVFFFACLLLRPHPPPLLVKMLWVSSPLWSLCFVLYLTAARLHQESIRRGAYPSLEACATDVRTVWTNAYLYNPVSSPASAECFLSEINPLPEDPNCVHKARSRLLLTIFPIESSVSFHVFFFLL